MDFQCGLKHRAVQVNCTSVVQQNTRRFSFFLDVLGWNGGNGTYYV